MVSSPVKKRFPTYAHLVEAGLMTEDEMEAVMSAQAKSEFMQYIYWMPISWASSLTVHAFEQGYIAKARYVSDLNDELSKLRVSCGTVISYDWVSLPLVYTQVVTLAVYTFFGATLIGRQWLDPNQQIEGYASRNIDYIFPIFTVLQFLFYVGWLKVAEALLNPYGEDDEDFDTNWMVDRHLQLSYMMVDDVGQHPPRLEKDIHWDIGVPEELPYTVASLPFRVSPAQTSAQVLEVPINLQQPIYPQYLEPNDRHVSNMGSMRKLNQAVSSVLTWAATPILNRRRVSQTVSVYSMPATVTTDEEKYAGGLHRDLSNSFKSAGKKSSSMRRLRRQPTTRSLSPFLHRSNMQFAKSRTSSEDSFAPTTLAVASAILHTDETARSRKASTISQLCPVQEGIHTF